jgi:hypothetical protein
MMAWGSGVGDNFVWVGTGFPQPQRHPTEEMLPETSAVLLIKGARQPFMHPFIAWPVGHILASHCAMQKMEEAQWQLDNKAAAAR